MLLECVMNKNFMKISLIMAQRVRNVSNGVLDVFISIKQIVGRPLKRQTGQ